MLGTVNARRVSFVRNWARNWGGGLYNFAPSGGASTVVLTNATLSGNVAYAGGGLYNQATAWLIHATVKENESYDGDGILTNHFTVSPPAVTNLRYSALDNGWDNCAGSGYFSYGHNIEHGPTCPLTGSGDLPGTDPKLGVLAWHTAVPASASLTLAHFPRADSPVIDAGNANCVPDDQRGYVRPADGNGDGVFACDIGAIEYGATAPVLPRLTK